MPSELELLWFCWDRRAVSDDGIVFDRMAWLAGGRRVDYPHVIEHDGRLLIAFSGGKQTVEILIIDAAELDGFSNPVPADE